MFNQYLSCAGRGEGGPKGLSGGRGVSYHIQETSARETEGEAKARTCLPVVVTVEP